MSHEKPNEFSGCIAFAVLLAIGGAVAGCASVGVTWNVVAP